MPELALDRQMGGQGRRQQEGTHGWGRHRAAANSIPALPPAMNGVWPPKITFPPLRTSVLCKGLGREPGVGGYAGPQGHGPTLSNAQDHVLQSVPRQKAGTTDGHGVVPERAAAALRSVGGCGAEATSSATPCQQLGSNVGQRELGQAGRGHWDQGSSNPILRASSPAQN